VSSMGQAFGRGSAHVCVSARQGMAMARQPCSSGPARWCVRLCTSKSSAFGLREDGAHARAHGKAVAATWPRRSRNAGKAGPRRCLAATRNEGDGGSLNKNAETRWSYVCLRTVHRLIGRQHNTRGCTERAATTVAYRFGSRTEGWRRRDEALPCRVGAVQVEPERRRSRS